MDLRLMAAAATDAERAAVDDVLGSPAGMWDGGERGDGDGRVAVGGRTASRRRDLLLPALHALQNAIGWISEGGLNYVCERLSVPPAEAYGVASFYAMFSLEPTPPVRIDVCDDVVCRGQGALDLCDALEAAFGPEGSSEDSSAWRRSPCLGQCDHAPAVLIQVAGIGRSELVDADVGSIREVLDGEIVPPPPRLITAIGDPILTRRMGTSDPADLDAYRRSGGYTALQVAIDHGPERALERLEAAELRGRGGAAFPTAVKWRAVAGEREDTRYVVCNADESEPGTFKDRVLMEQDPLVVVEGLTLAGYVTGAHRGYVYIRGEYPLAARRLEDAIAASRDAGLLGADVAGTGFAFDIEIRRGAGAYICGEETSLFNSIEGFRGEPRSKPPFPTQAGLFGKPTAVNNVETLAAAVAIVADVPGAATTKLFSLSGDVARPGLYEVPFGVTVRALIAAAGGVAGGREPGALLLGGAAGRFLAPTDLDGPLGYSPGSPPLGSGALMVFDDSTDLNDVVLRIAAFFRHESCGQCVPCRVGTMRQEEALQRLVAGSDERLVIADIAAVIRDASICGLGQFAAEAVTTALDLGLVGNGAHR